MKVNIGFQEIILVLLVALILLGPKKIKEIARALGKMNREFQKAKEKIVDELEGDVELPEDQGEDETEPPQ